MKRRLLSILLVLVMVSSMTISVFAETVVEEIPNGTSTVTTETVTDPVTGAETTTTETVVDVNNPDGSTYDMTETKTETEDASGTTTVVEGQETTVSENKVEVTVQLVPGQTTSNSEGGAAPETTGDQQDGEDDPAYNETTITKTDKTVTAQTGKVEISLGDNETIVGDLKPLQSQIIEENNTTFISEKDLSQKDSYGNCPNAYVEKETPQPEGYDFKHVGVGLMSRWLLTMNGNYGGAFHHRLENVSEGEQNIYSAYCVDFETGGKQNHWYRIDNLEDAGYFDEDAAEMIRAIATNGYWATEAKQDAEGNQTAIGSLEKIKQDMKQAVADGKLSDENMTAEEMNALIDGLTEGMALNATQAAIWTYANGMEWDGLVARQGDNATEEDYATIGLMLDYLTGLDPMEADPNNTTEIIDQYSIQNLAITVGDRLTTGQTKVVDDQVVENDTYAASVSFALVVKTDNRDNLIVKVMSADGSETLAEVRLAGEANDNIPMIYPDKNGNYTISGLEVAENEDFSFNLTLEGTQYLEQGVYIYTPEGETRGSSQTLVGMAEGTKEVNLTASVSVNFQVEDGEVIEERRWRSVDTDRYPSPPVDPQDPPQDPPVEEIDDPEVPLDELPDEDVPKSDLTEILEEEVPLANVPMTGDCSLLFIGMSILSGTGLAGLALTKKREDEE